MNNFNFFPRITSFNKHFLLATAIAMGAFGCAASKDQSKSLTDTATTPATAPAPSSTPAAPSVSYAGSPATGTRTIALTSLAPSVIGATIVSYSISPSLPSGLTLDTTTGVISGTPTTIQTSTAYTVTAVSTDDTLLANISITVNDMTPAISYAGSPFTFTKSTAISAQTPVNTGGTITSCSSSPTLPAGLALSATCVLSGTPTVSAATASYTISATNTGGTGTANISITVYDGTPGIAYSGSPFTFIKNSAISSQTPTNTGDAITSCSSSPTLPTGLALSTACVLTGTPTAISATATYTISATNSSGTGTANISITVNDIVPAIAYSGSPFTFIKNSAISSQTPTNTGGTITSCSSSPTLPAGLALSSTCVLSGTPTAITATATYTISATNSGGTGTANISITVNDAIPAIAYAGSPFTFTKGSAVSTITPTNSGGTPTSCSASPTLPTGLSLSAACEISGTPTAVSATATYAITATNTTGSQSPLNISITVNNPPYSLSLSTVSTASGTVTSGDTTLVTVQLKDASGNDLDTTGLTITFNHAGGTSTGSYGSVTDNGNGTYSALFTGVLAGTATTLEAKIAGSPITSTMPTVTVTPGPVASLAFTSQPDTTRAAGQTFSSVAVTLYDLAGNIATSSTDLVTLSTDSSTCTAGDIPGGTLTATPTSGVATFTSAFSTIAGTGYCLTANANGYDTATSSDTYTVTPGTVTSLVFTQEPSSTNITATLDAVTVSLADMYGNVDTTAATKNITLAIGTNPGGSTLSGTLTQATSAGVATFANLSLNNVGVGYTLTGTCTTGGCTFSSATSTTFDITNTTPVNLESVIELVDAGISSATSAVKFNATQVNLDPSFYDGTVTYTYEVVAKNTNATTAYNVTLNSKTVVASGSCSSSTTFTSYANISIPANTTSFKRFTTTLTAPTTAKGYAISLPATSVASQIQVASARIVVKQVGARKTRIFVPMTSGPEGTFSNTTTTPFVDTTTAATYTQPNPNRYYTWKKDVAKLVTLAGTNALTLEAVLSNSAASTATSVGLTNVTTGNQIATSVIAFSASGSSANKVFFCSKSFDRAAANFTDNENFEVFFKTGTATSTTGRLHKSGLWVTLTGVTNLQTYNRLMRAQTITSATTVDSGRRQLNSSFFSSPTVTYECIGSVTTDGITPQLATHGVNETGVAGVSTIGSSGLSFSGSTKQKQTSSSLSITDGDRHLSDFTGTGSLNVGSCLAIIQIN